MTQTVQGVYNINRGYAVFRRIEILSSNDEYYTIKKGTDYGLSVYDHIVLDANAVDVYKRQGIAVPHMIKQLFKTAKPIVVIPGCFLGGAVFCLFSDLLARTLFSPTELSISSVTAVFGAPVVIAMMIKRVKR